MTAGLEIRDVRVSFGGLVAVDRVSLDAPRGRITGLIGPNGAGKTTLFNACTGVVRPAAGHVLLDGVDITRWSSAQRARHGLGRTFQRMELFNELTVAENVALGREAALAGGRIVGQLVSRAAERRAVEYATRDAIDRCGLAAIADQPAGALSTGQRRLVELARGLAGEFTILLLDEPSSGLDHSETGSFGSILLDAMTQRDRGILLVEHDMELVMRVCNYVYVVDFGQLIFEGTPDEVRGSDLVRAAYLGNEAA